MCFFDLFCNHLFLLLWIDHIIWCLLFIHLLIFSCIFVHWLSIQSNVVYSNYFNWFSAFFIWVFDWEFIDFLQFLFLCNRLPLLFWGVLFIVSIKLHHSFELFQCHQFINLLFLVPICCFLDLLSKLLLNLLNFFNLTLLVHISINRHLFG